MAKIKLNVSIARAMAVFLFSFGKLPLKDSDSGGISIRIAEVLVRFPSYKFIIKAAILFTVPFQACRQKQLYDKR